MRSRRHLAASAAVLAMASLAACGTGDGDAVGTASTADTAAPTTTPPQTSVAAPTTTPPQTSVAEPSTTAPPTSVAEPSTSVSVPPLTSSTGAPTTTAAPVEGRTAVNALAGVHDVDGVPFDIATVADRDVLLWFWAPW